MSQSVGGPATTRRPRTAQRLLVGLGGVVLLTLALTIWVHYRHSAPADIADEATVSASSVARGMSLPELVSGGGGVDDPSRGWSTHSQAVGAWFKLEWPQRHELRRIVLQRSSVTDPGISAGYLTFGDGSEVQVRLSTTSRTTIVPISPRRVDQFQFTVSSVSAGALSVGLAHVSVYDEPQSADVVSDGHSGGNAAGAASVSASNSAGNGVHALVDGARPGGNVDTTWQIAQPKNAWVRLRWAQPRELDAISVTGAKGSTQLQSGTLVFSDGSRLSLGAVLADPTRPTVIAFMPRATTSLQLTFNSVSGAGPLVLSDMSADEPSTATFVPVAGRQSAAVAQAGCGTPAPRPTDLVGVIAQCPVSGSEVTGSASINVSVGPSYDAVTATILPGDASSPALAQPSVPVSSAGTATLHVDTHTLPSGPFTVRLTATATGRPPREVLLQLDKAGTAAAFAEPTPSVPARGRSLVYADEFTQPLSISHTGAGATYTAAKPTVGGVQDFGDAIFADPALNLGNFAVVNNQYLRISVQPRPPDFADPSKYGRQYVGGLLSSARPGGSGFSAQYGYFEARMLVPESPGTWPAFWMLPSPNLIAPEKTVAEIDAVELYGHQPTGSCQSTHQFTAGKDRGIAQCSAKRWDSTDAAARWHTYGVSIAPNKISFYIDNKLVATAPQVIGGDDPMFFLVDLALGGGWPVNLSSLRGHADLYVDYVRVYV